jgi:hypothetical protein
MRSGVKPLLAKALTSMLAVLLSNRSYFHFAEGRHTTEAIADSSIHFLSAHSRHRDSTPLFLYVSFAAAQSPLQPLARHLDACMHLPHKWRRQYCGLVRGLDEAIYKITEAIKYHIGENTLLVVLSVSGGSSWRGATNSPLRGGSGSPLEGGVRTPAFIVDFTHNQSYLGRTSSKESAVIPPQGKEYHGLMHCSDWLPTLLGYAGASSDSLGKVDGFDFGRYFRSGSNDSPRSDILIELFRFVDLDFPLALSRAYLMGDMKLIEGRLRDPHLYSDSTRDALNSTDKSYLTYAIESAIRVLEWSFGVSASDKSSSAILNSYFTYRANTLATPSLHLFNLSSDPTESNNLADEYPDVVREIQRRLDLIEESLVGPPQSVWMRVSKEEFPRTLEEGDCSMSRTLPPWQCNFIHPWLPDGTNPWSHSVELFDSFSIDTDSMNAFLTICGVYLLGIVILFIFLVYVLFGSGMFELSVVKMDASALVGDKRKMD